MTFDMGVMSHICIFSILCLVNWEDVSNGTPFAISGVAQVGSSMDFAPDISHLNRRRSLLSPLACSLYGKITTLHRVRYPAYIFIRVGENSSRFRRDSCYTASAIRSIEQNYYGVVHHFPVY